jgi:hypothetical protein
MLLLGAINKTTGEYTHPTFAEKRDKFICPGCQKDVILCQGQIRIYYFRHNNEEHPCNHYNNPCETALHKDAKELMKTLLNRQKQTPIIIKRKCTQCLDYNIEIKIKLNNENTSTELEYRFEYGGSPKIADVAYLQNGELKYVFEICHTHKTKEEDRPEPWFEIDALTLITSCGENTIDTNNIVIRCIRNISGRLSSYSQHASICCNCYQNYITETKKIREYINNKLGFEKFTFYLDCALYDWLCQNQKIIDLFNKQLGNTRVIILGWRNSIKAYIFDKCDYKINLINFKKLTYDEGIDEKHFNKLNWKRRIDYGNGYKYERDEDIIYDLIQFSKTDISKIGNLKNNDAYRETII